MRAPRLAVATVAAGWLLASACPAQDEPGPSVEVTPDARGATGVIHGVVDIHAPQATVWKALLNCSGAPSFIVNLKSCRVVRHDEAGRWDEREQISRGTILPGVRTVIHADYEAPSRIHFHSIAGDLRLLEGEWRLEPLDGGARTRVYYDSRLTAPYGAPGPIVRSALRSDIPKTLASLREVSEAARP